MLIRLIWWIKRGRNSLTTLLLLLYVYREILYNGTPGTVAHLLPVEQVWFLVILNCRVGNILQNGRGGGGAILIFPNLVHLGHRPPMKKMPYAVLGPSASRILVRVLYTKEANVLYLCLLLPTRVILPDVIAACTQNSELFTSCLILWIDFQSFIELQQVSEAPQRWSG